MIQVNSAEIIKVLSEININSDYFSRMEDLTQSISKYSAELTSAVALHAIRYSTRGITGITGGRIMSKRNLDIVLERLERQRYVYFMQYVGDLRHMCEILFAKNLIYFCFEFSKTLFENEYNVCRLRYVEHIKVDDIRQQMGIRKATVCNMAADEIHLVMMMYAVTRCSNASMKHWNILFASQTIKDIVTHPERLTAKEQTYIDMDELREYALTRLYKN